MKRGELWLADVDQKKRPVLILTRSEVIDVRALVTVAEVTTTVRGLASEVHFDHLGSGLAQPSVINCDGIHTVNQSVLTGPIGSVGATVMADVCSAVNYSIGC